MGRKITAWTPDRVAQLERLVEEGQTDRQIAQELGTTKGAVDQVAHRLGIPLRGQMRIMDARHGRNPFYRARKAAGLTRAQAAMRAGVSEQLICEYERGAARLARWVFWQALAQTYGCSVGDLLGDEVLDTAR